MKQNKLKLNIRQYRICNEKENLKRKNLKGNQINQNKNKQAGAELGQSQNISDREISC